MQSMALGWLALELSDSAFIVGVVAAAGSTPILLFSLHAGVVVDRGNKLRLVAMAQALLAVEAAALWWLTWSGHATVTALVLLAAASGVITSLEIPARQSLMVELVGREDLRDAIALNSSGFNLARIIGPAAGAVIVARFGIAWCFGVNALSYVMVLLGLAMVRLPEWHPPRTPARPLQEIRAGLSYVWGERRMRALLEMVTAFSILGIPYIALMPVLARDRLGLDASGYGLMLSVLGVGGLTGALVLAGAGLRYHRPLLYRTAMVYAVLLLLLSLARSPAMAMPLLFGTGFLMIVNNATANGLLQTFVPDEFRGRLMSMYSLIVIGLPRAIGALAGGAVARVIGVHWAIGISAVSLIGFDVWLSRRYPEVHEF